MLRRTSWIQANGAIMHYEMEFIGHACPASIYSRIWAETKFQEADFSNTKQMVITTEQ
jgi:hypothetical protein